MRMLDAERKHSIRTLQLYLTPEEAQELSVKLERLLSNPEANDHAHIESDFSREFSFSIVTPRKLAEGNYTKLERQVLSEE